MEIVHKNDETNRGGTMIKQVIYKMKKMLVDISKRNILFRKMCRNINLVIKK